MASAGRSTDRPWPAHQPPALDRKSRGSSPSSLSDVVRGWVQDNSVRGHSVVAATTTQLQPGWSRYAMMVSVTDDPFVTAEASAAQLTGRIGRQHDIAVVLGSGWTPAADALGTPDAEIPLVELGGFPPPTVVGHTPSVRSVTVGDRRGLLFLGRVHLYEGLPPAQVVH